MATAIVRSPAARADSSPQRESSIATHVARVSSAAADGCAGTGARRRAGTGSGAGLLAGVILGRDNRREMADRAARASRTRSISAPQRAGGDGQRTHPAARRRIASRGAGKEHRVVAFELLHSMRALRATSSATARSVQLDAALRADRAKRAARRCIRDTARSTRLRSASTPSSASTSRNARKCSGSLLAMTPSKSNTTARTSGDFRMQI